MVRKPERRARLSVVCLSVVLVLQSFAPATALAAPVNEPAAEAAQPLPPLVPSEPGEQPELRTQLTKTVKQAHGRFVTTVASSPLNYLDDTERWQPVDARLVATDEAGFAWKNAANAFQTRFRQNPVGEFLTIEAEGRTASLSMVGALNRTAVKEGDDLVYRGVLGNVDLEYAPTASGVKETLVLNNRLAPSSFAFELSTPGEKLEPEELPDGSWAFWAADLDDPLFVLTTPYAEDAKGVGADGQAGNATMDVTAVGDGFLIDLAVDPKWLADASRAFPVRLDPTVVIGPASTNRSFKSSCASCTSTSGGRRNVGGNASNHWIQALKFGIGQIPAGATITNADVIFPSSWATARRATADPLTCAPGPGLEMKTRGAASGRTSL